MVIESVSFSGEIKANVPVYLTARVRFTERAWFKYVVLYFKVNGYNIRVSRFVFNVQPNSTIDLAIRWTPPETKQYLVHVWNVETYLDVVIGESVSTPVPTPVPDPVPTPVPVPGPTGKNNVVLGRCYFSTDSSTPIPYQATNWPIQIRQGDRLTECKALLNAGAEVYVYATPVAQRTTDPNGFTTSVLPKDVPVEWLLRDASGNLISRDQNGDYALDVGNQFYAIKSAEYLVAKCKREGWTGVALDEINQRFSYSFPGARPAKYPTDALYQDALFKYVEYVSQILHQNGFKVSANLGSDQILWAENIARLCDVVVVEFAWASNKFQNGYSVASIANGYWKTQLRWAEWLAKNVKQPFLHANTKIELTDQLTYALVATLLVTQGNCIFGNSSDPYSDFKQDYDASIFVSKSKALLLGAPVGPYTTFNDVTYSRQFTNGLVLLNAELGTSSITINP